MCVCVYSFLERKFVRFGFVCMNVRGGGGDGV